MHGNQIFQQDERSLTSRRGLDLDQSGKHAGNLHHGEDGLPPGHALALFVQKDGQIQTAIAQRREGVALIHRKRREHRPHVASEANLQGGSLFLRKIVRPDKEDSGLAGQFGRDIAAPILVEGSHHVVRAGADAGQLFDRRHAIGVDVHHTARHQLLEARNADHEELVEIARHDGLEFQPLGQLNRGIACLFQDARIELQPRQFAVKECPWLVVGRLHSHLRLVFAGRAGSQGWVLWCSIQPVSCDNSATTSHAPGVP